MKRFYKMVSVSPEPGGFTIRLDGRPVKTPARNLLIATGKALSEALQAEWAAQGDMIVPDSMPLTQLLNTQIDKVANERAEMEAQILKFLDTDLLCYRCVDPPEVAAAQQKHWNLWLDWFERTFEATLKTTTDLAALKHPTALHDTVRSHVKALEEQNFTVLQMVVPLTGSLVLGLALTAQAASPDQVWEAMFAEENYKAILYRDDQYGPDPLTEKKRIAAKRDLQAAARYLSLH